MHVFRETFTTISTNPFWHGSIPPIWNMCNNMDLEPPIPSISQQYLDVNWAIPLGFWHVLTHQFLANLGPKKATTWGFRLNNSGLLPGAGHRCHSALRIPPDPYGSMESMAPEPWQPWQPWGQEIKKPTISDTPLWREAKNMMPKLKGLNMFKHIWNVLLNMFRILSNHQQVPLQLFLFGFARTCFTTLMWAVAVKPQLILTVVRLWVYEIFGTITIHYAKSYCPTRMKRRRWGVCTVLVCEINGAVGCPAKNN